MNTINFIPPRVPFLDASGYITREWYLFLQDVFERIGGSFNFTLEELAQIIATLQVGEIASPPIHQQIVATLPDIQTLAVSSGSLFADVQQPVSQGGSFTDVQQPVSQGGSSFTDISQSSHFDPALVDIMQMNLGCGMLSDVSQNATVDPLAYETTGI